MRRPLFLGFLLTLIVLTDTLGQSRIWVVNQHHRRASDAGRATEKQPFKTIGAAARLAQPGDTVLVHAGVYRERVTPARGGEAGKSIVYQSAYNEQVTVKGSEVLPPNWQPIPGHAAVFQTPLDPALFGAYNPFRIMARRLFGKKTLGQVFVDGIPLAEVDQAEDLYRTPNTWMVQDSGRVLLVHALPAIQQLKDQLVEVSVRERIFAPTQPGLGYITVRGFTFEHAANQFPSGFWDKNGAAQAGAVGTGAGHHWVIEYNTIRFAKSIGLDCGSEGWATLQKKIEGVGYHRIRYNTVSDNGACGIAGYKHTGTHIVGNWVERNNSLGWTAPETGGIKVHAFVDGVIEGNVVRDNNASGIWLDNVYTNSRISRNTVVNNGLGIFIEMGTGPVLIDNNVVALNGDGIYTHDASGVTLAHNLLLLNRHFGVYMRVVTERKVVNAEGERVLVATNNQRILNNVFIDNYRGQICMPLSGDRVQNNLSDYNLFIGGTQWHWEGLGPNRFVLGRNDQRISGDTLAARFVAALNVHQVPAAERPVMSLWKEQPYLTFDWWKMMTGFDQHSQTPLIKQGVVENGAVEKGSVSFSPQELFVEFRNAQLLQQLQCSPIQGVTLDFYGNLLEKANVWPGPFQQFQQGYNRMVLYPMTEPGKE